MNHAQGSHHGQFQGTGTTRHGIGRDDRTHVGTACEFLKTAQPVACVMCHGEQGDGKGLMGAALVPPPRNFTCGMMMGEIPDGQLFWIIKNGSPGTGMMAFPGLPDEQVCQQIHYIRSLAK